MTQKHKKLLTLLVATLLATAAWAAVDVNTATEAELDGIKGIERLTLTDMRISDISGIENFPLVTYLDLSQNYSIADLTPLLKLPNLLQATLSWNVREAAAELEKTANFEIIIKE